LKYKVIGALDNDKRFKTKRKNGDMVSDLISDLEALQKEIDAQVK